MAVEEIAAGRPVDQVAVAHPQAVADLRRHRIVVDGRLHPAALQIGRVASRAGVVMIASMRARSERTWTARIGPTHTVVAIDPPTPGVPSHHLVVPTTVLPIRLANLLGVVRRPAPQRPELQLRPDMVDRLLDMTVPERRSAVSEVIVRAAADHEHATALHALAAGLQQRWWLQVRWRVPGPGRPMVQRDIVAIDGGPTGWWMVSPAYVESMDQPVVLVPARARDVFASVEVAVPSDVDLRTPPSM